MLKMSAFAQVSVVLLQALSPEERPDARGVDRIYPVTGAGLKLPGSSEIELTSYSLEEVRQPLHPA